MQTQGIIAKDSPRPEKPKAKEIKSVYANAAEPLEQDKKNKKDRRDKKRRFWGRKEQNDTPATGNNAINALKKKKKNRDCDISRVTCYNCNKKGHYVNICTEPKN